MPQDVPNPRYEGPSDPPLGPAAFTEPEEPTFVSSRDPVELPQSEIRPPPQPKQPPRQPRRRIRRKLPKAGTDSPSQPGLDDLVAAITRASLSKAQIELPQVVDRANEITDGLNRRVQEGTWHGVDARELELLVRSALLGAQIVEAEQITHAVKAILADPSIQKTLAKIAAKSNELTQVADQVASDILPADAPDRGTFRWLVLGAAVLLAAGAGIVVPLLAAPAIAETILTNEVAIAALTIAAATLVKRN